MIIAGTGHRPTKIALGSRNAYDLVVYERLVALATNALIRLAPTTVISGMALGWDTALADAALDLRIPLWAYVPFTGQEGKWIPESQAKFHAILSRAARVEICSPGGYAASKMQVRNIRMVDDCNLLLALWDGSRGGTGNCVEYAQKAHRRIVNLWPSWAKYAEQTNGGQASRV